MEHIKLLFSVFSILLICSCSGVQKTKTTASAGIECSDPRPEMCTREYAPVCAVKSNGIQCIKAPCPNTDHVTFSNGCTACADLAVQSYQMGPCKD